MKIKLIVFLVLIAHGIFAQDIAFISNTPHALPNTCLNSQRDSTHFTKDFNKSNLVHIGLDAGINISNAVYSHSSYFTGNITGIRAGFSIDIPIEFSFSFASAILYSQKGYFSKTKYGSYTKRLNFFDMPLLLKSASIHSNFNFFIGPQLSLFISTKNTFYNGFTENQSNYSIPVAKFLSTVL
jgi:hypothetical protein